MLGGEAWGGGGWANCKFLGKKHKVYLIIIREWPKHNPPLILRYLDNFPPGAFYSDPPTSPPPPHLQLGTKENLPFSNLGQSDLYGTGIKTRFQLLMAGPITRCVHCKLYITVRHRIVRYPFVDYRALFLWTKYLRKTLDFT